MKRILLIVLAMMLVVSTADARRKKEAAGTIQDGMYQDNKYDFQFKIHDNWQPRPKKDDDNFRLVLLAKNYGIPPQFANAKDYTYIPRMVVYADTTSMALSEFVDSLLSPSCKSKQKKTILSEFEFLSQPEIVPKDKKLPTIAGKPALVWQGEAKYVKDVSASASSAAVVRQGGAYSGCLVGIKDGKTILLFQVMCESHFHDDVFGEAFQMINSLAWEKAKDNG